MPITPGGRWSPADSDDWDLTTDLAAMQVSNEAATANELAALPQNYRVGTNAQRLAIPAGQRFKGLRFFATDTNIDWMHTGLVWDYAPGQIISEATKPTGTQTISTPNTAPGTEVTGISLAFTLPAARTVNVTGLLNTYSNATTDVIQVKIRDNTTDLRLFTAAANSSPTAGGTSVAHTLLARIPLTAGAHRLNIAVLRVVGSTGSVSIPSDASATNYMFAEAA